MDALALEHRFEEAADVRDRAAALVAALARQRRLDTWRRAGTVRVAVDGTEILLEHGRLALTPSLLTPAAGPGDGVAPEGPALLDDPLAAGRLPVDREHADEIACVARWFEQEAGRVRLLSSEGALATPLPHLPDFAPRHPGRLHKRGT